MASSLVWVMTTVGLSLLIAVRSSPCASAGEAGSTSSSPAELAYIACGLDECCPAPPPRMPANMCSVSGARSCPPDIECTLAASLMIWLNAS